MKHQMILYCALVAVSLAGCSGQKSSQSTTTSTMTQGTSPKYSHRHGAITTNGAGMTDAGMTGTAAGPIPRCGAVRAVWVNTRTHVYHDPGDPYYGRTKNGKYMCPRQAVAEGDRPARERAGASNTGQ